MCRLAPVKGLELAVETLAGVMNAHPSARLMICGGDRDIPDLGSYQAALQKLATQLGVADRVIFPGNVDIHVVKRYLAAADVHLAPSMVDTFNYAVIEAGLAGTPTLASTAVGAGPWMAEAGAGSVVGDRAVASWTAAANALLALPPTLEQRQHAADKLATELHPDAVTARLADLLLARTAGRKA
jgi:glycosyltransferase involved in cell wall biosynthesis